MTARQRQLLQAIIDDFIDTAEAVGSAHLAKRYRLNLSPATIRNEMADLVKMGYLEQPHSSSGRVPTTMGYKEFIDELLDDIEELDVNLESMAREELFQRRFDLDDLVYDAVDQISGETDNLSFAIINNRIYYSGLHFMVRCPEFNDSIRLEKVLRAVEDHDQLKELLNKFKNKQDVRVLFGDDTGIDYFAGTALIYKVIKVHGDNQGFIGLIGPTRMNYAHSIAFIDFIGTSINNMLAAW